MGGVSHDAAVLAGLSAWVAGDLGLRFAPLAWLGTGQGRGCAISHSYVNAR